MAPTLVLIVDDDANLREIVRFALDKEGFTSVQAANGQDAIAVFEATKPGLVVLDIMMPELDGTEVCRQIRKTSDVPIIFLSSRDEELDRILGLELGGDDYLTKPFSPRELAARVKAVCRRAGARTGRDAAGSQIAAAATAPVADNPALIVGPLRLDQTACKAYWEMQEVVLTATEFGVLRTLMAHPRKVYSRDELMQRAYDGGTVVSDRTIDSHIRRVRRKFAGAGVDPIETVTGFGYKLAVSPVPT